MASKIIAQIIIQGTAIFSRAFVAAYTQALQNAKAGGTAPNIAKITKHKMQTDEALKILGFEGRKSLNPQVLTEKYTKLFEANGLKGGSFYLQSKIYRAKEALDTELLEETKKDEKKPDDSRKAK